MKMINTVELKNHTNEVLRQVRIQHLPVAVTLHGRPAVAIIPLTEESLEDLVFDYSPTTRQRIREAEADVQAGRVVTWKAFLERERTGKHTPNATGRKPSRKRTT